ncbi:aminoacyl-tRNA hydrolase [Methylobacterium sp. BTF04]|uniref:alternative ribosome rescue aminoacyl-tRNA hydrolase ArfB n=1 Tax=Methylobacterium sp. BTF04 TaxID=2708300 RepID=UPI0013D78DCD|nr:alternative ribosome rescue aminoacyl-tRNA hydrolase ArfB [Methylobacterium sp. BTF04]NEU12347.1 aminoacyl-tRNA hydrolase [Methylobacterium sp. BTF04]
MVSVALYCTPNIAIDEGELDETFVRASGPGGQNVNKLSTAVQLRFDARRSAALPNAVAVRLMRLAGRRLTQDGIIVISAQRFRTQDRNRADARERLAEMVAEAAVPPTPRRATRPTLASKKRRLDDKSKRGATKRLRGDGGAGD